MRLIRNRLISHAFVGVVAALLATTTAMSSGAAVEAGATQSDKGPIKVGVLLSGGGTLKTYVDAYNEGFEYFKEKNPKILGRRVEYVQLEDGGEPATAVPAAQKLLQDEKVDVVVGPYLSGPTSAVLPIFNQSKILNINLSGFSDAGNPQQNPYTFRVEQWKDMEGKAQLAQACKLGAKSIGTIVVNNPLGTETDTGIKKNVDKAPCKIKYLGSEQFATGDTDVTAQANAMRKADVVMIGAAVLTDFAAVMNALSQVQYDGWIEGNQAIGDSHVLDLVPAAIVKQIIPFGVTPRTLKPLGTEVQGLYNGIKQSLGREPGNNWNKTWDSMTMIKEAAEGARSLDAAKMKKWLETHRFCGAWGCYVYSAKSHQPFKPGSNVPYKPGSFVGGVADAWEQQS